MQIRQLCIRNYKLFKEHRLPNLENALILVGKNSTGKTAVLEMIRAIAGDNQISTEDFRNPEIPVTAEVVLELTEDDLQMFYNRRLLSEEKEYQNWLREFAQKFPSFQENKISFTFYADSNGGIRYADGINNDNDYI